MFYQQSEDYRPLFWFQGRPIYVHSALVIFHVVYFVGIAIWIACTNMGYVFAAIDLAPSQIFQWEIWRFFTYFSVDPYFFNNNYPTFILYMCILYFAGKEVEQFIGRSSFFKLYVSLLLIPALLYTGFGYFFPFAGYIGIFGLIFGVYIAFATLYPNIIVISWMPLPNFWMVWACLALFSLIYLALHDFSSLLMLWLCSAVGYFGIRMTGAGSGMTWLIDWMEERRTARLAKQHNLRVVKQMEKERTMDEILEKISKQGMASLTSSERAVLERARTELLNRDKR